MIPRRTGLRRGLRKLIGVLLGQVAGEGASSGPGERETVVEAPERSASETTLQDVFRSIRLDVHETARPVLMCFQCEKVVVIEREENVVRDALLGNPPRCSHCDLDLDVWKNTLFALTLGGGLAMAAQVGAHHTSILYRLGVGEVAIVDLHEKGVPGDAMILRVAHSAALSDGLTVVDLDATDSARVPGFQVRAMGVRLSESTAMDMQVQTTVTWAHHDADDDGRRSLNRALLAIVDGRFDEAIVPANVAVEVTLARVLAEHLRATGISDKRIQPFLTDAATYSHQLNVLLPLVLDGTGAPPMSDALRGRLNRLQSLRNDIGHQGRPKAPLTKDVAGECVAGAVFGFHYARVAAEFLAKGRKPSPTL